ncbi:MAG TPA: glycine oxidase ThiO [Rhizomicrobium sp.]|jgi:glycine oxidase
MKIVIVGAGVAGLSIGWRLRQAGAEVTILERAEPGKGATWASAGMIAASAELGHHETAESEFARRSSGLWPIFAAEVEQATNVDIHYGQTGSLIVARDADEAAKAQARVAHDSEVSWLDRSAARAMEPMLTGDFVGALWAPGEANVDSRALGRALTRAFVRAGGTLSATEAAYRLEVDEGRALAIKSPFKTYEADAFIIAAGAWSGQMFGLPEELAAVKPVKGEMIALEPPGSSPVPAHVIWGNAVYLVPRRNTLLVGATSVEAGFDTNVTDAARDFLRSHAETLLPGLAEWEQADHWAGLRPGSPDGMPLLGPTTVDRLYAATGQYRNGILFAPAIADAVSKLVLDGKVPAEIAAFDPRRFAKRAV